MSNSVSPDTVCRRGSIEFSADGFQGKAFRLITCPHRDTVRLWSESVLTCVSADWEHPLLPAHSLLHLTISSSICTTTLSFVTHVQVITWWKSDRAEGTITGGYSCLMWRKRNGIRTLARAQWETIFQLSDSKRMLRSITTSSLGTKWETRLRWPVLFAPQSVSVEGVPATTVISCVSNGAKGNIGLFCSLLHLSVIGQDCVIGAGVQNHIRLFFIFHLKSKFVFWHC